MLINREFAQKLCLEMGIAWDPEAAVPTLQGRPVSEEDVGNLFFPSGREDCCTGLTFSLSKSSYNVYGILDLKCA